MKLFIYKQIEKLDLSLNSEDPSNFTFIIDQTNLFWKTIFEKHQHVWKAFQSLESFHMNQINGPKNIIKLIYFYIIEEIKEKSLIEKIIDAAMMFFNAKRESKINPFFEISSIINILEELNLYNQFFEEKYISTTLQFYSNLSRRKINEQKLIDYFKFVENARKYESQIVKDNHIEEITYRRLIKKLDEILITEKKSRFIGEEMHIAMFDQLNKEYLKLLYEAFDTINDGDSLRKSWELYLKLIGEKILQTNATIYEIIDLLIKLIDISSMIIADCFENKVSFINSQKNAFDLFLNIDAAKTAEMISRYQNFYLCKENKNISLVEIERVINYSMKLFKHLQAKDIYEKYYIFFMAKRIIYRKSISNDIEEKLLQKLNEECGSEFTKKAKSILNDFENSNKNNEKYQIEVIPRISKNQENKMEFYTLVLPQSFQSIKKVGGSKVKYPIEIYKHMDNFYRFYVEMNPHQLLIWIPEFSYCEMDIKQLNRITSINIFSLDAIVLLLFNNKQSWSLEEIEKETNIDKESLKILINRLSNNSQSFLVRQIQVK